MDTQPQAGGIAAVVLAAGRSLRMGRPKMTLPWGNTTVIGRVIQVLVQADVPEIVVVTGGAHELVSQVLSGQPARLIYNPHYRQDEMALSLKAGLQAVSAVCDAAMVVLGDQPQIEPEVVEAVMGIYLQTGAGLVVPSYQMRRGHPWLIARALWPAVLKLEPDKTLRQVLNDYASQIVYVEFDTSSILRDLDTPEDYQRERP